MNFYVDPDYKAAVKYVEFGSVTRPSSTSGWFGSTTTLRHINWRNFDPSKVGYANNMFYYSNIEYVDLSNQKWISCKEMFSMFMGSKVRYVRMPATSNKLTSIGSLFSRCSKLSDIDVSQLDTSNVTDFAHVFGGQFAVNTVIATTLDLRNWDTSSATNMQGMFSNCRQLEQILGLETFDVSHVSNFQSMFRDCRKLDVRSQIAQWRPDTPAIVMEVFNRTSNVPSEFEYPPFILLDNVLGGLPPVQKVYLDKLRPATSVPGISLFQSTDTSDIELSHSILEAFTIPTESAEPLKISTYKGTKLHTASHPDKSDYPTTNLALVSEPYSGIRIMSKSAIGYEDLQLPPGESGIASASHLYIPQDDSEYGDGYLWPSMRVGE